MVSPTVNIIIRKVSIAVGNQCFITEQEAIFAQVMAHVHVEILGVNKILQFCGCLAYSFKNEVVLF